MQGSTSVAGARHVTANDFVLRKGLRDEAMLYVSQVTDLNDLTMIPILNAVTKTSLAEFLNVPSHCISSIVKAKKKELEDEGAYTENASQTERFLSMSGVESSKSGGTTTLHSPDGEVFTIASSRNTFFTLPAALRVILLLKDSEFCKAIREFLADIINNERESAMPASVVPLRERVQTIEVNQMIDGASLPVRMFESEMFGQIRVVMQNGEPWFVAADVCLALQHSNVSVAMQMLDDDERGKESLGQVSGNGVVQAREMNIVSESGLYQLIMRSNLPEARKFKRWITHEVIPSIRKHGAYMTPDALLRAIRDPSSIPVLLRALHEEQQQRIALETENAALAKRNLTTDKRNLVNRLMRSYAAFRTGNDFARAYRQLYQEP